MLIDYLLLIVITTLITLGLYFFKVFIYFTKLFDPSVSEGIYYLFYFIITFLLQWWYFIIFEALFNGKTLGKLIFGLKVISFDGGLFDFSQIVLRNFMRLIDINISFFLVGIISTFFSKNMQRVGDIVSGTLVIKEDKLPYSLPDFNVILKTNNNDLSNDIFTGKLTENELYIIKEFLNATVKMNDTKKNELALKLAEKIRSKLKDERIITDPVNYLNNVYQSSLK